MATTADPAEASDAPLIFHWRQRREISLALPAFFILSVLVHAATFYLFQVTYPHNVTLNPPPAEVTLLTAAQANDAFRHWMDEEDPSLLLRPTVAAPPQDLWVRYHPSYEITQTVPQLVDAADAPVKIPSAFDVDHFLSTPRMAVSSSVVTAAPPPTTASVEITFSDEIQALKPAVIPDLKALAVRAPNVELAKFLVGISPNGVIAYLFLESSSGDPRTDRLAEEFLKTLRCRSGGQQVTWGFITVR